MTFEDIRPYNDDEIQKAMRRIAQSPEFELVAPFVYPSVPLDSVRQKLASITTVDQLQSTLMFDLMKRIIDSSISRFTYSGVEQLDPDQNYLFVSNHRDIVLDASLLAYVLFQNNRRPCQITFGANLMENPVVVDFGKSNRMFRVERGGSPREFYANLSKVSHYIHHVIANRRESVWIAQRNGRTKDGNDQTEAALVKMLGLYDRKVTAETYGRLHIVPMSISYEWEPCDLLKVREVCLTRLNGSYTKKPGEDLASILTGIRSPKGEVNITINKPVEPSDLVGDAPAATLAQILTSRIREGYRLMPTNYVAYDLLHGTSLYAHCYTSALRQHFVDRMAQLPEILGMDSDILRQQFLSLYANPVEVGSKN